MKNVLVALAIALFVGLVSAVNTVPGAREELISLLSPYSSIAHQEAAVFFVPGVSTVDLQKKYNTVPDTKQKVRVLIMPGHEPTFGGAEYRALRERDMVVELSLELKKLLEANSRYEVIVPRDTKNWTDTFSAFFLNRWEDIQTFQRGQKSQMLALLKSGELKRVDSGVYHNSVATDVALRIYGVNMWANENKVDLAIHIHFNDDAERRNESPGKYSGFTIYVPESQYSNSSTTKAIAHFLYNRLSKYNPVSDLPKESKGIVEEQDLIAVGSHNTADAPSMLIEYGYMYEPVFQHEVSRTMAIKDLAFQTYLGIQDFFGSGNDVSFTHDNLILPYEWKRGVTEGEVSEDVFALQTALMSEQVYPPQGKTLRDCPRTGAFRTCTKHALIEYQKKHNIQGESGVFGEKTRAVLNESYRLQPI